MKVSIQGLNQGAVIAALYNNARPQGMGFMHCTPEPMSADEAQKLIDENRDKRPTAYFDYLKGRVMKIDIGPEMTEIETALYDRDNGSGAAERVIEQLREKVAA